MTQAVFLYNKSNPYGISQDVKVLEEVCYAVKKDLGQKNFLKIRHADPLEPPVLCDIAFHFEIPVYSWFPWARKNALIVNPEWYESCWDSYLFHLDFLFFKCQADADRFTSSRTIPKHVKVFVLPWTTKNKPAVYDALPQSKDVSVGALWLLGASRNKRSAAEKIIPLWKTGWPKLHVYTTTPLTATGENVEIHVTELEESNRKQLQAFYPLHLIFSQAEALGLAAFEGQAAGAFLIGNGLPTFQEGFADSPFTILLQSTLEPLKAGVQDTFAAITQEALEEAIQVYLKTDLTKCREFQKDAAALRQQAFQAKAAGALLSLVKAEPRYKIRALPPILGSDMPNISVITLLHNRRRFVDLCFHNLLITDYPKEKIEWVVVEDSDKVEEQASDKIMKFARQQMEEKGISVSYIPLQKVHTIGEKRNMACQRAQHDIILMMDDDDHYPSSSFSRRVAWLTRHPSGPQASACTTIACYDLLHGTSAVNTPPWTLGLKERISEATLVFFKKFWEEKPFPSTNMAEGEGFLEGREEQVLELQPQQIIVAMSHGQNASSRRIPQSEGGNPSCFWGFPKEFLIFLHRLAGVNVEIS